MPGLWAILPRSRPQQQASGKSGDCGREVPVWLAGASPHRVGKPLKLGLETLHSARRGDYRVIYHIDDQRRLGGEQVTAAREGCRQLMSNSLPSGSIIATP